MNDFIWKNKIGIWMVCLCLVIGCIWKTDCTYAKETGSNEEIGLELTIGYDGNQVRYARKNRAIATITNDSPKSIDGVVKLYLPGGSNEEVTVLEQPVHVDSKQEVEVDLSFLSTDMFHTIMVCLEDENGNIIIKKETVVKKISSSILVYGILSKNPDSLAYFSKENKGKDVVFEENDFPDQKEWLDIVDVLVVGDCNLQMLHKEQQCALTEWVKDGGTVVIGNTGKDSVNNLRVLGIKAEEREKELAVTGISGIHYKNADITIYPVKQEKGAYVVCSKSIEYANTELGKKSACVSAVGQYYGETADLCSYLDYHDDRCYGGSWTLVDEDRFPLVWVTVLLLSVYVFLITVVLRFLLKKKDKLEYMWGLIPLCALVFMGIVYFVGAHSRVSNVQLSYQTVVEYAADSDTGKAITWVSLVNPSNKTYEVNIPEGMEVGNANAYEDSSYEMGNNIRKEIKIDKNNGTITFEGNSPFDKVNLYGIFKVEKTGSYESSITCKDYEYSGTFTNHMGSDMKKVCFLAGKRLYYVGDIKDGETVEISQEQKNTLLYSATDLYADIQAREWLSFGQKQDKNTIDYGYMVAVYNYLESYSYIQRLMEPKMIYITEEEGNRNRQWGVEDTVGYTVNVLNIDVDYTQGEDTFVCDILSSKYADEIYSCVSNDSSIENVVTCQLGENETLTSLKYLEVPNDFGVEEQILGKQTDCFTFDGKIELYNLSTGAYETVFVKPGQELTKKELAPYVDEENKIKICLVVDHENPKGEYIYEFAPVISATVKEDK